MAREHTARVRYISGMRFDGESGTAHQLTLDASADDGGQDAGFRPMELLLLGLAGCTAMDVISILRKKRLDITAYEVRVSGVRADEHPMIYTDITVQHIVTGRRVDPVAVARAIELSETTYCGAGAMLSKAAKLTHIYRIVEAASLPGDMLPDA
jgi:putative redox protein